MNKHISLLVGFLFIHLTAGAQNAGWISGSFESRSLFFLNDPGPGTVAPQDRFASNNYLWLQFNKGPVSAGLQLESYMPPLAGYPYQLEGTKIVHRFIRIKKGFLDITAGNFYEQFGSGLSFRSFELRALGMNNAMDGVRVLLEPVEWLNIKAVYGKQRKYLDNADAYLRGIDSEFDLGQLFKWKNEFIIGGGVISKYEPYFGPDDDYPSTVNAFNSRINASLSSLSANAEFVIKTADPSALNIYSEAQGSAFLSSASYTAEGFGSMLTVRFLNNMDFSIERDAVDSYSNVNYLPANTMQHIYLLSNLYPYPTQPDAEASLQADFFYRIPAKTSIGGKYGTKLRLNFSQVRDLQSNGNNEYKTFSIGDEVYYSDLNFEINRLWTRRLRTILFLQALNYNKGMIESEGDEFIRSKIIVADMRYSINRRFAIKAEVQHLWSQQDHGNWVAGQLEVSYAPNWAVFIHDMTDYEYSGQVHYINTGISYSNQYFRTSIAYGRNRAGYICSGGVCQIVPAYTGFNLYLTSSF